MRGLRNIWVREVPEPGRSIIVDMEGSRFSAVCRKEGENVVICNVHHSMPFLEQIDDEYYPKTLTAMANEAVKKSETLERRLQLDHMTELYNRVYMERHLNEALSAKEGYFFLMDLDNFKVINDTKGHLVGDEVIIGFATILKEAFSSDALVGRMGGDEFAVWDNNIKSEKEAEEIFNIIALGCKNLTERIGASVTCSMGVAFSAKGSENFAEICRRADIALYASKAKGKGTFSWAKPNFGRRKTDRLQ